MQSISNPIKNSALARQRILAALSHEQPLTNQDLYDRPEIREVAKDANQVSVMLAEMYKWKRVIPGRGLVTREHFKVPGSNVKYAYKLLPEGTSAPAKQKNSIKPILKAEAPRNVEARPEGTKPSISVSDSEVVIELPSIRIVVQIKGV